MNLHLLELFGSKASGFGDNVFGHGQLANVVQQGGGVQRLQLGAADAQFLGDFNGIDPHTLQVIVRGLSLASIARARASMVRRWRFAISSTWRFSSSSLPRYRR